MQEHPKRHGYLSLGSRVPKQPLRDSTAYEMGRFCTHGDCAVQS